MSAVGRNNYMVTKGRFIKIKTDGVAFSVWRNNEHNICKP